MVLWSQGKTRVLCTASVDGGRAALAPPHRPRLDDRRVLAAARVDRRAHRARGRARQAGRAHGRDPAADRARAARASSTSRRSASGRSSSTATCSRPTAARAARRSAARTSRRARALDRFGLSKALTGSVAAVSVGIVDGEPLLDLDYSEDSNADVDLNVVMTGDGRLVEVQATAEQVPFDRERARRLLDLAAAGIEELAAAPAGGDRCSSRLTPITISDWESARAARGRGRARRRGRGRARAARPRGRDPHAPRSSRSARRSSRSSRRTASRTSSSAGSPVDPTRIAAQIVTGIGFLGAGAIIRSGLSVRGLTTAASLWIVAAIGMARRRRLLLGGRDRDGAHRVRARAAAARRLPHARAAPARRAAARRRAASRARA